MALWADLFRRSVLRLNAGVTVLLQGLTPRRPDDAAGLDDLDRVWRAECDEMDAILGRKDPGRFRK
jgi:hypothetical protein